MTITLRSDLDKYYWPHPLLFADTLQDILSRIGMLAGTKRIANANFWLEGTMCDESGDATCLVCKNLDNPLAVCWPDDSLWINPRGSLP